MQEAPPVTLGPQGAAAGGEFRGELEGAPGLELAAAFTLEDAEFLCSSLLAIPGAIWGEHMLLPEQKVKAFAAQLYRYCLRKNINLFDYFFDEMGLIAAGIPIVMFWRNAWNEHKKDKKLSKKEQEAEKWEKEKEMPHTAVNEKEATTT